MKYSIIVPVYNSEQFLKTAIESVINQDYHNWELILVNDGSTDNSLMICENYAKLDKRIKVIDKVNSGVSDARNVGIDVVRGCWLFFLDADDWLEVNYISVMNEMIQKKDRDLFICNYYEVVKNHKKHVTHITKESVLNNEIDIVIDASLRQSQWHGKEWYGNLRSVWGKCFNINIINKNNIRFISGLKYGEDMVFVLSYLLCVNSVGLSDLPLYNYRHNKQSIMHSKKWKGIEQGKMYFDTVDKLVGKRSNEGALADLWLEIAESDWDSIHNSSLSLITKYLIFNNLINQNVYKRFTVKNSYQFSSNKQKIYIFSIRYKITFILILLSFFRMYKHKNDYKKGFC